MGYLYLFLHYIQDIDYSKDSQKNGECTEDKNQHYTLQESPTRKIIRKILEHIL